MKKTSTSKHYTTTLPRFFEKQTASWI